MGRRKRPWVRGGRNVFYSWVDDKLVCLDVPGPDTPEARALAEAALARLLAGAQQCCASSGPVHPVSECVANYLAVCELRRKSGRIGAACLVNYRIALAHLTAAFGSRPLSSLTAEEVELWSCRDGWSPSYRHAVLGVVGMMLRHAGSPIRLDRPPVESRGPEVALSDDQFARVLDRLYIRAGPKGDLREFLTLLRATGARPSEALRLTVEGVDWENCCRLVRQHKTKRKTGRGRLLVFNGQAMTVLKAQRDRYGSGLLFRTRAGRAFTPNCLARRMIAVSKRVGFRVIAYGQRHSFATRALESGVPDTMVAALLGHASTTMIHRHYSHVASNAQAMRAAAEKVSGG